MWISNTNFWHCRESNHWMSEWSMCFTSTLQCPSNYLSFTRRPHILISANHHMERFSKNDSWVTFNKITSFSMTLSEGNRHSFRICLANERYFHIKSFSGEIFFCHLHFPDRAYLIPQRALLSPNQKLESIFPITGFSFPKWSSFNTRRDLSFPKWLEMALIKVNLCPLRRLSRRSQNIAACRFCRRQVPWSSTLKHLSKPFIRPDWYILRRLCMAYCENTS